MISDRLRKLARRTTCRAWLIACVLFVLIPPAVAYAESFNYCTNAVLGAYATRSTSGHTTRQFNEVWRPIGNLFRLDYSALPGYFDWYDTWSNPFLVNVGIGDAYAECGNEEIYTVYSVTCHTTRP
jgi:hypothetical protein